ncbi:hypothetical protein IKQ02_03840 [bacterium]|nr:hypothetical protein [bacterium]
MNNVYLLDCTLRDGGYVNDWNFGFSNIKNIISNLENSGVNILELGFLRNETQDNGRTAFSCIENINALIAERKKDVIYSAMIEAFNPFDLNNLSPYVEGGVDLIRICIWKRCLKEHIEYCKKVKEKGYKITIQPSRVEQYSDEEFIEMIEASNELEPYALYVVDTWGTQSSSQIKHYMELADKYLIPNIKIGYHGHNNKLQALSCAEMCLSLNLNRDLCIDSSIMGMGRGAGNLNTEVIMEFINEHYSQRYKTEKVVDAFNCFLLDTYNKKRWGYSMYSYLCSVNNCNPNYANYFIDKGYQINIFEDFLKTLTENEKIVFSANLVEERIKTIK